MPRDYAELPATHVRRSDRAIQDEDWIRAMLQRVAMGTLATIYNGQPFINSNLFAYDETTHAIYMHTAQVGRTRANVEREQRVCFSVSEMGRLLPAATAKEMSVEYAGVVVFGQATIVEEPEEARHGLQLLLDKYFAHLQSGVDYQAITEAEIKITSVYRISVESWSGKRKQVDADFPGAFFYPQPS